MVGQLDENVGKLRNTVRFVKNGELSVRTFSQTY